MGFLTTAINFIPGISEIKLGLLVALGVAFLGLFGTIGYLKYENSQLENTVLKKQNLLDNATNVIKQEKEANDTLLNTINQLKTQITQIIREQQNANKTDNKVQGVKEKNVQVLSDKIEELTKNPLTDDYDSAREDFLNKYNQDLECRRQNPSSLSACQ